MFTLGLEHPQLLDRHRRHDGTYDCIVPGSGYDSMARTFAHMLRTLNVNDDAAHRATETSSSSNSRR